ncbi:MAG TPA: VWA domain-containing protein [Vicinamibacterales bacterium]|nr:VWA domain-containing protein [Vicinamibacterales bacterium]
MMAATAQGSSQSPPQQPTFPARVETVSVDVVVFDREGRPVEGLTRDQFTVKEDGRPQVISNFDAVALHESPPSSARQQRISSNADRPDAAARWYFVVFDDVNVSQFSTLRAREAMMQLLERALQPGDHVMITSASGGSSWTGTLPEGLEDLKAFVQRLQGERRIETGPGRIWDYEAMGITLGNDSQAEGQVARRYFENGVIPEAQLSNDPTIQENFGNKAPGGAVAPGFQAIRVKARQTYTEAKSRLQVSLGTLERLSEALVRARGRKTLLLFSEGFIMDPTIGDFRTLVRTARTASVAVHFIDVGNPGGALGSPTAAGGAAEAARIVEDRDSTITLAMSERDADGARSIAADTGGSVVMGTNLLAGMRRIAAEGRSYYLLGYSPVNTKRDGKFRKIEVTVNRRDVEVRARGGYYAASDNEPPPSSPDKLDPAVRAALDAPFGTPGIPLRVESHVLAPQPDGTVSTLLFAEADLAPLRLRQFLGAYSGKIDSYVLVHDRNRGALQRDERLIELDLPPAAFEQTLQTGLPIRRDFLLKPGRYQATLLLRDRASGLIGSVRHEFSVPGVDQFRISTPLVTDVLAPPANGQPPRPVPTTRRAFGAGGRIYAGFDVFGAAKDASGAPRVSVGYSVRRPDGTQIAGGAPQPVKANSRGEISVVIGVTLPPGVSGDHELALTIRDDVAMRTVDEREDIVIVK